MSDTTRKALAELLAEHWWGDNSCRACECGEGFGDWDHWSNHINDLIAATFLVVPRSDIVGTEYGWRFAELGMPEETWLAEDRSAAVGVVRSLQREQARDPIPRPGPQLLERPRLPWSVIPLCGDGAE